LARVPRDWFWRAPYLAVGLFALVMLGTVWGLQKREAEIQRNALARDMVWTESTFEAHLRGHAGLLREIAIDIADGRYDRDDFRVRVDQFLNINPELGAVAWANISEAVQTVQPFDTVDWLEGDVMSTEKSAMAELARERGQAIYGPVRRNSRDDAVFELYHPVFRGLAHLGTLVAVYSVDNLLAHITPTSVAEKYHLSIVKDGQVLATRGLRRPVDDELSYTISLDPPASALGLRLVVVGYRTTSDLSRVVPVVLIVGLTLLMIGSLWLLRRHVVRRLEVEKERDRLFSLSLDMLCIMDVPGTFRRVNPAFKKILGYPADTLLERQLLDFVHDDDMTVTQLQFRELANGAPRNFENRFRCADGRYKWLMWSVNPVIEEGLLYAVAHDITGRKEAEQALRAEYAFRQAMEASVMTGLRAIDLQGRIIYVNAGFSRMVGWSETELVGMQAPFPYWPPEEEEYLRRCLARSLAGDIPPSGFELRLTRKSGERFYARMYVSPLIDASGRQTGWMTSMNDITEPKRARAQLEASHERFVTVLDGLDAVIHVAAVDTDEILFANRAFKSIYGGDAVGRNCWDVTVACQPERDHISAALQELDAAGLPCELFDGVIRHLQSGRWYHLRERAIRWVDGRVVRVEIATDITDRKNMEEEHRQQMQRLQHTARLITMGEMASSLAHELNQPLGAIANYSSGCVNRLQSGEYRAEELLAAMQKTSYQAERAGKIIRQVRAFVHKSEPNRAAVGLARVIEDAVSFAEIEARRMNLRIRVDVPAPLPPVFADHIMIEQVLLNLIKNGIEAMGQTPPAKRRLLVSARANADGAAEISVADNGCGVSDSEKEKLFEPFYTTKSEGMGIGLNICRTIVELHEGRLWLESGPRGGCVVRFTLPFVNQMAREARA
jgi:PAS domain S-box-containing protein